MLSRPQVVEGRGDDSTIRLTTIMTKGTASFDGETRTTEAYIHPIFQFDRYWTSTSAIQIRYLKRQGVSPLPAQG
jgi:hypothetical protein